MIRQWLLRLVVAGVLGAAQGWLWGAWLGAAGFVPGFVCGILLGALVVAVWPVRYGDDR